MAAYKVRLGSRWRERAAAEVSKGRDTDSFSAAGSDTPTPRRAFNVQQSKRATRWHVTIDKPDLEGRRAKKRTPVRDHQLLADHIRVSPSIKPKKTRVYGLTTGD